MKKHTTPTRSPASNADNIETKLNAACVRVERVMYTLQLLADEPKNDHLLPVLELCIEECQRAYEPIGAAILMSRTAPTALIDKANKAMEVQS